ncbi:MAG: hypothetical protein ACRC6V_18525 [Bacteroidales bacterium]
MSNGSSAVVSGIAIAVLSGACVAGVQMYNDVQSLKMQYNIIEKTMDEREETTRRFTLMMAQMDKTLAVQTEAVNTLKEAVKRIEDGNRYAYEYKEFLNDGRN